ncbi:hypothetical protein [Henriciella sp.]|uniref:hypothetical protein n=1 Tax=Henriciella sp. TaxID=1968823 RepID=UPI0026046E95|nr:hypothetical protein [Henriciella sp.]
MQHLETTWTIVSTAVTIVSLVVIFYAIYATIRGLIPVLIRLGYSLWQKRIIIFADNDMASELQRLINDSRLFNRKRIEIAGENDVENARKANVVLVYWRDAQGYIDEIVRNRSEHAALIIYAPHRDGAIPGEFLNELERRKHITLCNFRGRLMNDVLTSMMTIQYDKG